MDKGEWEENAVTVENAGEGSRGQLFSTLSELGGRSETEVFSGM